MSRKWVFRPSHPKANARGFVAMEDLGWEAPKLAVNAPVLAGRFYENTKSQDGEDIGSRKRHREYMKRKGVTAMSDYTQFWKDAEKRRAHELSPEWDKKQRREDIGRAWYERTKP